MSTRMLCHFFVSLHLYVNVHLVFLALDTGLNKLLSLGVNNIPFLFDFLIICTKLLVTNHLTIIVKSGQSANMVVHH
jgi:hypothetical protein